MNANTDEHVQVKLARLRTLTSQLVSELAQRPRADHALLDTVEQNIQQLLNYLSRIERQTRP